jgi:bifunctional DNA-binding transcriptional regulator/antitoxin component of YhaV-PrlF toxin-antitoxin module
MARTTVEPDGRVLLPAEALEASRIRPGQELEVVASEGHLSFSVPAAPAEPDSEDAFLRGLELALEDVRAGRVTRHASDSELLAALDGPATPR